MNQPQDEAYRYVPLFESWQIDEKIGEGSYGVVYKVSKREMGETYDSAMKVISVPTQEQYREVESSFGGDQRAMTEYFEDIVKNIVREIKMLYSLGGNANIIGYQDHKVVKKQDGLGWEILIRMEYVTSLRKYQKEHSMTREDVMRLGIDICSALETCSKKGIVHRDIKDDNIFVSDDGVFKLGDFGIARELSKSGRAASMRGTPLYMAPEIYRGDKYDAAVDIYSLGIVLYKMLNYGRMPLTPPYPEKMRYQDSEDALELRMSGASLPNPANAQGLLADIVLRACAYSVQDRYASPAAMKADMLRALASMSEIQKQQVVLFATEKGEAVSGSSTSINEVIENEFVPAPSLEQTGEPEECTVGIFSSSPVLLGDKVGEFKGHECTFGVFESVDPQRLPTKNEPYYPTRNCTLSCKRAPFFSGTDTQLNKGNSNKKKFRIGWILASCMIVITLITMIAWVTGLGTTPVPSTYIDEASNPSEQQQTNNSYSGSGFITELNLSDQGLTDISFLQEDQYKHLEHLNLSGNNINDISALAGLTNLKSLNIGDNSNLSDISVLAGLTNLEDLRTYHNNISDISALSSLKKLNFLGITDKIGDISALSELTELRMLYLTECNISDISALKGLKNLYEVVLDNNSIYDISALAGLTDLSSLSLCNNKIYDISDLSGLINLNYLQLSNNQVTDINPIANLVNLRLLLLANNPITDYSPVNGYYDKLERKDFTIK